MEDIKTIDTPLCDSWRPLKAIQTSVILILILHTNGGSGQSYTDHVNLFNNILGNSSAYNTAVRPLRDQSQMINVTVSFFLVSILTIDDIQQQFVTNAFMEIGWTDEIATWNPADYNNVALFHPYPKDIWRPRMVLLNTLDDRDLFEDDYTPFTLQSNGRALWYPGSLFPASCKLNLRKYPFDKQNCSLQFFAMGWIETEMSFSDDRGVIMDFYTINGEWDVESTEIKIVTGAGLAGFEVCVILQRRSGFFILNIMMPVVLLSFLNIIVFVIPVDSGEKISYGITVLLALAVYLSIVSDMLPRSSDIVPLVTIYLFVLLIISVLTVVMAIVIVWLHHKEEKEMKRQKASTNFKNVFHKFRLVNRGTTQINKIMDANRNGNPTNLTSDMENGVQEKKGPSLLNTMKKLGNPEVVVPPVKDDDAPKMNKYKLIGCYIDTVSFFLFTLLWLSVTLGFTLELSS